MAVKVPYWMQTGFYFSAFELTFWSLCGMLFDEMRALVVGNFLYVLGNMNQVVIGLIGFVVAALFFSMMVRSFALSVREEQRR